MVSSAFNSHIADFSQGWMYVVGVGVLGGMVQSRQSPAPALPWPWTSQPRDELMASRSKQSA